MRAEANSYPPFDTPKPVADGVWLVDGRPLHPGGMPLPIRMTVIRLANGDLLLHSPVAHSAKLADELDRLGQVRHLVAPSFGHWMFVRDWQHAYPQAETWAAPGVRERPQVRRSGLRIDQELGDTAPAAWGGEIDLVLVRAGPVSEVELFHRPSRTLVLTDLVVNLEAERLPRLWRSPARLLGVTNGGKAPAYLRAVLRANRAEVAESAARLISLEPERVIFAHGAWYDTDATARLRQALGWLLDPAHTRKLAGKTVVITGASSGIGRAAALAFARQGANVILGARRTQLLQTLAGECEALGGRALAVTTDVTDPAAVERLAQAAEGGFGRIDVWINNAGVGVFGSWQDTDLALHRRTIEVNLLGSMHGAWAAIPRFTRQGSGTLINNISLGAWSPTPFAAAYTASKFGLRGFTASLRQELAPYQGIHVCGVFPAIVDTPGFTHGANTSGLDLDPGPLLYAPEDVARVFIQLALKPRAEVVVGWPAGAAKLAYAAAPRLTERVIDQAMRRALAKAKPAPRTEGALLHPIEEGHAASGGWLRSKKMPSARVLSGVVGGVGLAALGIAAIAAAKRRR